MKLKNNDGKKLVKENKNNSPKKQGKGVVAKKEKLKEVVKPTVLKKEAEKIAKVETIPNPQKVVQQELWKKAIQNVSKMSNLSDEESSLAKLLDDYKKKDSIPQKSLKLKNFITKGFSKFKDTNDEVLEGFYDKLSNEFKALGGKTEEKKNTNSNKSKVKSEKEASDNEEMTVEESNEEIDEVDDDNEEEEEEVEEEEEDEDDDEEEDDDEDKTENIELNDSEDSVDESEKEKPKPKAKGNKPNNRNGKNISKFKGGKVQKNKKFGKKK